MAEAGLLTEDSRVELIDGEIIEMAPIGSPHAGKLNRLIRLFSAAVDDKAIVSAKNPVVIGEHDEPQPDFPEAWLINLQTRCLEVYRAPEGGRYRRVEEYRSGCVAPESLPDVAIDIAELFPEKNQSPE